MLDCLGKAIKNSSIKKKMTSNKDGPFPTKFLCDCRSNKKWQQKSLDIKMTEMSLRLACLANDTH